MTDFTALRDQLLDLRRKTLVLLAERVTDHGVEAGLLALVANVQATLAAIDEEKAQET